MVALAYWRIGCNRKRAGRFHNSSFSGTLAPEHRLYGNANFRGNYEVRFAHCNRRPLKGLRDAPNILKNEL